MTLPVRPPVSPMLAKLAREMPTGDDFLYEPKWDGFRCIVFRDGDEIELGSRNERPLTRYFPELLEPMRAQLPDPCVLDGEIVIAGPDGLDFNALLQRVHPAASRVKLLSEKTPASFVAFDILGIDDRDLRDQPFSERRPILSEALSGLAPPLFVTPATRSTEVAADWFSRFEGAGLDGVVAKRDADTYREGERVMVKVKHERTADCVVGGFRWHKTDGLVGSLLLGLFDPEGRMHHVGVCSSFTAARRKELVAELETYRIRRPGLASLGWLERRGRGDPDARRAEPLDRREGPLLGATPARARLRGRLRPPPGRPLSSRDLLPTVAPGPDSRVLHLLAARFRGSGGALRSLRHGLTGGRPPRPDYSEAMAARMSKSAALRAGRIPARTPDAPAPTRYTTRVTTGIWRLFRP